MDMGSMNWLAVVVAALVGFALGAAWYNQRAFGRAWVLELRLDEGTLAQGSMARIMVLSLVAYFVIALNLEAFLGQEATLAFGAIAGFLTGFGFIAMMLAVFYLFEQRSLKIFLINAGYATVTLTLMGAILGAF